MNVSEGLSLRSVIREVICKGWTRARLRRVPSRADGWCTYWTQLLALRIISSASSRASPCSAMRYAATTVALRAVDDDRERQLLSVNAVQAMTFPASSIRNKLTHASLAVHEDTPATLFYILRGSETLPDEFDSGRQVLKEVGGRDIVNENLVRNDILVVHSSQRQHKHQGTVSTLAGLTSEMVTLPRRTETTVRMPLASSASGLVAAMMSPIQRPGRTWRAMI